MSDKVKYRVWVNRDGKPCVVEVLQDIPDIEEAQVIARQLAEQKGVLILGPEIEVRAL